MKWDFEGDYLLQFHPHYRGTIGDRFCRAVRAGCEDVDSVMEWVYQATRDHENEEWRKVAKTCDTGEAYDFAMHILERESLPWEAKCRLKEQREL